MARQGSASLMHKVASAYAGRPAAASLARCAAAPFLRGAGLLAALGTAGLLSGPARAADCAATISTALVVECELPAGLVTVTSTGSVTTNGTAFGGAITNSLSGAAGLDNSGSIADTSDSGFSNTGTLNTLTNNASGTISGDFFGVDNAFSSSGITTLTNSGLITGVAAGGSIGLRSAGLIGTLNNNAGGTISGQRGIAITNTGVVTAISNSGLIQGVGGFGFSNGGAIGTLTNQVGGSIAGLTTGLSNGASASVQSLINLGTITGTNVSGIVNSATITTLTNLGTITGNNSVGFDINNSGTIITLNNLQGVGNPDGALRFNGNLPVNYNIVINSTSSYGQLQVTGAAGATIFGIAAGSTVSTGTYSAVLSGLGAGNLTVTTGSFGGTFWSLVNSSGSLWDLIVGPATTDTQQSLTNTAAAVGNAFALQSARLGHGLLLDCPVFGAREVCVAASGAGTRVSGSGVGNTGSAVLVAALRLQPHVRVGAYLQQDARSSGLGAAVQMRQSSPMVGVFAAWSPQDDGRASPGGSADGAGVEVKVSAAYGRHDATVTRAVVGSSEAGRGAAGLDSLGVQLMAKFSMALTDGFVLSPYAGVRYSSIELGGYTEAGGAAVSTPLTFGRVKMQSSVALAGAAAHYRVGPQTLMSASLGVEADISNSRGNLRGSNSNLSGLSAAPISAERAPTRPTASLSVQHDLARSQPTGRANGQLSQLTQRLGLSLAYRQEPFQAAATTAVAATYTVGF